MGHSNSLSNQFWRSHVATGCLFWRTGPVSIFERSKQVVGGCKFHSTMEISIVCASGHGTKQSQSEK